MSDSKNTRPHVEYSIPKWRLCLIRDRVLATTGPVTFSHNDGSRINAAIAELMDRRDEAERLRAEANDRDKLIADLRRIIDGHHAKMVAKDEEHEQQKCEIRKSMYCSHRSQIDELNSRHDDEVALITAARDVEEERRKSAEDTASRLRKRAEKAEAALLAKCEAAFGDDPEAYWSPRHSPPPGDDRRRWTEIVLQAVQESCEDLQGHDNPEAQEAAAEAGRVIVQVTRRRLYGRLPNWPLEASP